MLEDLEGCKKVLIKGNLFQVDDGWEPTVGDWLEPDKAKFPNGMKAVCDRIHAEGYLAGIWLAPFVCTKKSEIYQKHQDWLLKVNGKNWLNGSNWGGFYSLDLDNPEVIKHIRKVFKRVFDEWGFDLVKLDFLYAAAPFPSKTRSRAGKMIDAMKLLREVCKDKLILGCGVPMMPAFGLVDYCRIGCDVSLDWDDKRIMQYAHRERVSTSHSIDNTIYRRQLNNRAWINDPDVFFLRDDNIVLSKEEKQYLYAIDALMDGILLTSDNPANYSEEQIREFKEAIELREKATDIEVVYDKTPHIEYKIDGKKKKLQLK
ncbi:MAG: alpha-galactosidase [Erysipelotrichaceae bacterium]|nr:alpha-galactosidase [Erysipelotrichaceae bacterium]